MDLDLTLSGEFRFARGWFIVAASEDVVADKSHRLFFFDRRMVAFRNPDGVVSVLDAVCPHMGAELGVGGLVDEGGVRCPYHHWRFGPDGKCNDIPYSSSIPPQARVRTYPVREVNGCIFVWHDPEQGEPDFEVPVLAEFSDPQWVPWTVVRRDIRSVPIEVIDNFGDYGHFVPVHQSRPVTFEVEFGQYHAVQTQTATHETLSEEAGGTMKTVATYTGPGLLLTTIEGRHPSIMLLSATPIDDSNLAIWFGLMVKSDGEVTPEFMKIRDEYVAAGMRAGYQDVEIWENKSPVERPLLCRGDGPILKAREWYKTFLRPRTSQSSEIAA
jgi:3-ketosteroid 9alpha-monooxygenase subunit A